MIELGIEYLSLNEVDVKDLFTKKPNWGEALVVVERSEFAVSLDFDFGHAVSSDDAIKDVFVPDSNKKELRGFHFPESS